jgi:reductive dehalogenase
LAIEDQRVAGILRGHEALGRYPMHRIKRVDRPTTLVSDAVQRIDMRDNAYGLARRGEYGPAVQKGVGKALPDKYPLSAAQKDLIDHIALYQANPVGTEMAPIPGDPHVLTRHLKALGYFLKADLMGACKVPQSAYYSHDNQGNLIEDEYENALVIVMRKESRAVKASEGSDWIGDPISFQAYQHLGLVAETIANYVRRLGWDASAQYGPSFVNRYSVLLPPLLLAAGIGEVSRIGIILNPFIGPAFKAAAVLTNMPLVPDQPVDFGLQRFCENCQLCAENCPSKAISTGDKVTYNGYETWKLDTRRCASFNFTNQWGTMCNRCIKCCPWTYPATWPHNLVRSMVSRSGLAGRIAIKAASMTGLDKNRPHQKWWFDMEYVEDTIVSRERDVGLREG